MCPRSVHWGMVGQKDSGNKRSWNSVKVECLIIFPQHPSQGVSNALCSSLLWIQSVFSALAFFMGNMEWGELIFTHDNKACLLLAHNQKWPEIPSFGHRTSVGGFKHIDRSWWTTTEDLLEVAQPLPALEPESFSSPFCRCACLHVCACM